MRKVSVNGVVIATQTFGAPGNPAIVLVMGATASMLGWPESLCRGLAERGFFVVRYDHRDTGESTTCPPGRAGYSVEDMTDDLIGVMDAYDLARAHIMGMSLGGFIGQIAALRHPDRVESLILVASEPLGWDGVPLPHIASRFVEHFGRMAGLDWADRDSVVDFLLGIARLCTGSAHVFDADRARQEIVAVLARTGSIASAFNHSMVQADGDWTGRFRDIAKPVLIIHGDEDPILPLPNGQALADGIRGARLMTLEGVGHELPEALIPAIVAAVADVAG